MTDSASAASSPGRGFANARNAKLHLLAKKKRVQQSEPAAASAVPNGSAASPQAAGRLVQLSDVLQATPQHFDSYKVAAVERNLAVIDELPEQYHTAEVVYISKNNLQTLQGIEQFSQLRVLSASDNLLEDVSQLQILQDACPGLQVVSFERNPLVHLPNYRNKVIQMLPKLQMLDGQGISSQDRHRAAAALKQEAACMAVMMSNACMVHKLVRTAELLQLHTELRRALFGSTAVLRKPFLPSVIPLDLLKFLKLWDYEGSLSAGDRRIIGDALTREVVRVHRQLQHAAVQLKGPAQLPELHAWDAAFSQVMLAQQRTIIQLVELVNALHDEATKVVASLMPHKQDGSATQPQEEQEAVQQQRQQEREGLIADLRDAALELAGVLATNSPPQANSNAADSAAQYVASPLPMRSMDMTIQQQEGQQQQQLRPVQPHLQEAAEAQQQLNQQLQPWSPGSNQQQEQQHNPQQHHPQQQAAITRSEQQGPEPREQRPSPAQVQKPARRLSGNDSLRLRPPRPSAPAGQLRPLQSAAARHSSPGRITGKAATGDVGDPIIAAAAGSGLNPLRTRRASAPASPQSSRIVSSLGCPSQQPSTPRTQQQQQQPAKQQHPIANSPLQDSSTGVARGDQALSPTAQRLLRNAAAVADAEASHRHQQQQLWLQEHDDLLADHFAPHPQQLPLQVLQQQQPELLLQQALRARKQQAEWMEAGFGSETPQGPRSSTVADTPQRQQQQQQHGFPQQHKLELEEQRQSHSSLSLPGSSRYYSDPQQHHQPQHQQQQSILGQTEVAGRGMTQSHSASSLLQLPDGLPYLAQNNVVYERIERFTPVTAAAPGSPAAAVPAAVPAAAASAAAADEDLESDEPIDVSAMVAVAQSAARQLFAVEGVPGACGFFSPYPAEQQQQQQGPPDAQMQQHSISQVQRQPDGVADVHVLGRNGSEQLGGGSMGAGEISFAYGNSSTGSPEMHRSPSRPLTGTAAQQPEQQQQQQQQPAHQGLHRQQGNVELQQQQQQQLLWALLSGADSAGDADSPPRQHQQQQQAAAVDTIRQSLSAPTPFAAATESPLAAAPVVSAVAASDAAVVSPLSRHSSVSSSGDLSALRQRLFTSVALPSPTASNQSGVQSRPSGLADMLIAQQQQRQQLSLPAMLQSSSRTASMMETPSQQQSEQQQHAAQDGGIHVSRTELLHQLQQPLPRPVTGASSHSTPQLELLQQQHLQQLPVAGAAGSKAQSFRLDNVQRQHESEPVALSAFNPHTTLQEVQRQLFAAATAAASGHNNSAVPQALVQEALEPVDQQKLQQQQQPLLQESVQASSSGSTLSRVSGAALDQQQQQQGQQASTPADQDDAAAAAPAAVAAAHHHHTRQSARGVTLDDWNMQLGAQPQQQQGVGDHNIMQHPSRHPSLSESQQSAGRQEAPLASRLSLSQFPAADPVAAAAAAGLRADSPASGRSSRSSMVEAVAQILGSDASPPPAEVLQPISRSSRAASLSPRSSLANLGLPVLDTASRTGSGTLSPRGSMHDSAMHGSLAKTGGIAAAAAGKESGSAAQQAVSADGTSSDRAASPRPFIAGNACSNIDNPAQQAAAAASGPFATISAAIANDSVSHSPRQSVAASHSAFGTLVQQGAAAPAGGSAAGATVASPRQSAARSGFGSLIGQATPVAPAAATRQPSTAASASILESPRQPVRAQSGLFLSAMPAAMSAPSSPRTSTTNLQAWHTARDGATSPRASGRGGSPSMQRASSAILQLPGAGAALAAAATAAAAAGGVSPRASGRSTPTKQALADLQGQLVVLAVEKAALEKQVQLGLGEMEQLQEKVAQKEQLELTLHQMQEDLLLAQERLQQAGQATQQQVEQNQQLLQQMQQVQAQLAATKAQEDLTAAAEALSRRFLSRRTLLHFKQAAQASVVTKQLKQLATEHRHNTVLKGVLSHWRRSAKLLKGLQALQNGLQQRALQITLQGWRQGIQLQRIAAEQHQAAEYHYYIHTCRKALSHWSFYTYHIKQCGIDLPSSPSTASVASDAELDWQDQQQGDTPKPEQQDVASPRFTGFGSVRGFGSAVSTAAARERQSPRPGSPQPSRSLRSLSARLSHVVSRTSLGGVTGALGQSSGNRDLMQSGGLQQQNSRKLSTVEHGSPRKPAASAAAVGCSSVRVQSQNSYSDTAAKASPQRQPGRTSSKSAAWISSSSPGSPNRPSIQQEQQIQQQNGAPHTVAHSLHKRPSRLISLTADSFTGLNHTPQPWPQRRATVAAAGPAAAVTDGVPFEVQLTFWSLARAQRLRRWRLLSKGWKGWYGFLEVRAAKQQQLAMVSRFCNKHRTRRAWLQWQEYTEHEQYKKAHPDGLDDAQVQLLQQYSRFKQRTLLLQLVQAWWALMQRTTAARTAAAAVAARRRSRLLRQILRFMQQRARYGYLKRQQYITADAFRVRQLQKLGFWGWRQALAAAKAADPNRNPKLQQLMWKAVLHWKLLGAAAVNAAAREQRIKALSARNELIRFARAFRAWRLVTIVSAREQQQQQAQQAQQELALLQQQMQAEQQQHVSGVEEIRSQMQELQQQLEAAMASKTSLEQAVKDAEQQLQQQESSYQQQITQLNADHRTTVAVLQQQVEQAAQSTEETAEQLQQLQQQQASASLDQQQQHQQLQNELEQHRQQQQQWEQQQQQWQQREQELMQQVATSKSQSKQLASQLKRCSEKLNQQTQTVQTLKDELETAHEQVAAARHASRDQNLSLTHQALAAEREKLRSQQQLCSEHAAVQVLTQHVQDLEQQLQHQQDAAAAAAAEHGSEAERLMDHISLKEQTIAQLQAGVAANQQQTATQQAKVLREVEQLRSGWSQAKQIIKQQRRTIKAQELQLQLAVGCSTGLLPPQQQQQQYLAAVRLEEVSGSGLGSALAGGESSLENLGGAGSENVGKYPITGYVLQQQRQQHPGGKARDLADAAAENDATHATAGSLDLNIAAAFGSERHGRHTVGGLFSSSDQILNSLKALKQQHRQQSSHRGGTNVRPPMTPSSSTGGLSAGHLL